MSLKFSVVIPTRHRPEFIKESLRYIALQTYSNFEVIVSDNYSESNLSCKKVFDDANLANTKYVRPLKTVGMVENWNFALEHADGDYVLFLTDKMFLLPDTLKKLSETISIVKADIISWVDDSFISGSYNDYFGQGQYVRGVSNVPSGIAYEMYDPSRELNLKASGEIARSEQDKSTYSKGKICFGAYSKELIKVITNKYGRLFRNITPDYTSMIAGLSEASLCVQMADSGIVHIHTDLSNGRLAASNDSHAKAYVDALDTPEEIYNGMLIKGLYSSVNNMLTHDYMVLREKYQLIYDFNIINWLAYIFEDVFDKDKAWSSEEIEREQKGLYQNFVDKLTVADKEAVESKIRARAELRKQTADRTLQSLIVEESKPSVFKELLKKFIPIRLSKFYHFLRREESIEVNPPNNFYPSLYEAVTSIK